MRAFVYFVIVASCLHLMGCEPPPHTVVPNIGRVIGEFRLARDTCHEYASIGKGRVVLARRRQEGQDYYAKARGSNNGVITSVIVAIQSNKPISQKNLKKMLGQADFDRQKFQQWYLNVAAKRQSHVAENADPHDGATAAAGPADVAIKLAELAVEIMKIQNKRFTEERKELTRELRKCEWADWDSIKATQ